MNTEIYLVTAILDNGISLSTKIIAYHSISEAKNDTELLKRFGMIKSIKIESLNVQTLVIKQIEF